MIKDTKEDIDNIEWNVYGKIKSITKPGVTIDYSYDASGNRISKMVSGVTDIYVRDASGNVMSIYKDEPELNNGHLMQSELHLYGSSRLGIYEIGLDVENLEVASYLDNTNTFTRGNKYYELSNHLGNLLATVSDKKTGVDVDSDQQVDHYMADVVNATDYYPGGMVMPGRSYTNINQYRYGFNLHEKSDEIAGAGNHTTALFGEYDTRLLRRWNLDPKPNTSFSPYSIFSNNPIWNNDILLDTPTVKEAALMANDSYKKFKDRDQQELTKAGWNRIEKFKTNILGKKNQEVSFDDLGTAAGINMAAYSRTLNGKTEFVISNAGTNDLIDVGSDLGQLKGGSTQYAFSIKFAKSLENSMGGQEITYVGHSLGVGLAAANSLATGRAAITFNPQGISWGTRTANDLPGEKRNGQIRSFIVGGEAVDRSQRLLGSKANGQITYIHPQYGLINKKAALALRFSTDVMKSLEYHQMTTVLQSLNKAGIK